MIGRLTGHVLACSPGRVLLDVAGVGYDARDIPALTDGAFPQRRLFDNAPREIGKDALAALYGDALRYW